MGRLLALDHGSARCGVAATDPSCTIVTPRSAVSKPDSDAGFTELLRVIEELEIEGVVVGLPLGLDGTRSKQSVVAENFAKRLASATDSVWVEMFDERHTTSAAKALGGSAEEDSRAAAVLLERWLEAHPA